MLKLYVTLNPALEWYGQVELNEFNASQVYITSSWTVKAIICTFPAARTFSFGARLLRSWAAFSEDLSSNPSSHLVANNLFGLQGHCTHVGYWHTWKQNTHTNKTKIWKFFKELTFFITNFEKCALYFSSYFWYLYELTKIFRLIIFWFSFKAEKF